MGKLTSHVLDTAQGKPAAGLELELYYLVGEARQQLKTVITNADGRTDQPLLEGDVMTQGTFELVFHVGPYFASQDLTLPDPPFLGEVPVRFGLADPKAHYHVPLLVSPYSYSTYRGS